MAGAFTGILGGAPDSFSSVIIAFAAKPLEGDICLGAIGGGVLILSAELPLPFDRGDKEDTLSDLGLDVKRIGTSEELPLGLAATGGGGPVYNRGKRDQDTVYKEYRHS